MSDRQQLTSIEFESHLVKLLNAHRDGDIFTLYESPLLRTPLVQELLLLGEQVTLATSHELVSAVIDWGIGQFKPRGEQDWYSNIWRPYNVLHGYFVTRQTIAALSERLGIAEQTFYEWRQAAINRLANVLHRECYHPDHLPERQRIYIAHKLTTLEEDELHTLTLIALTADDEVEGLAFSNEESIFLQKLEQLHLLNLRPLTQPIQLKKHFRQIISTENQRKGHQTLFERFKKRGMIQKAFEHMTLGGKPALAFNFALEHEDVFGSGSNLTGLTDIFKQVISFCENDLTLNPNLWARFLLIASRVAHLEENLELALDYSRQALSASDLHIKLKAYYQRAKQLSRINLDECLSHYAVCFDLVDRMKLDSETVSFQPIKNLVTQMYIDRAWIFIQARPDYEQAADDLSMAEKFIAPDASDLWCDLYNGRAELVARTQSAQDALPFHLKAFTSAEESGEIERMTKVAYNVGLDYMYSDNYKESLEYFERSQKWAKQSGNIQTLGLAQKGLGGSHYFLGNYELALTYYLAAYETWKPTQNLSWLTSICFDLAEGYATVNDFVNARQYYHEGMSLADQLGHNRILVEFDELKKQFPALEEAISDRQALALSYVDEHGGISRQQYIDLTGVAKSQAYRDLEEMCQNGILQRVGQGRGTKYVRPAGS